MVVGGHVRALRVVVVVVFVRTEARGRGVAIFPGVLTRGISEVVVSNVVITSQIGIIE